MEIEKRQNVESSHLGMVSNHPLPNSTANPVLKIMKIKTPSI